MLCTDHDGARMIDAACSHACTNTPSPPSLSSQILAPPGAVRPFCRRVLINLNRVGDDGREDEFDFFNHHRDLFLGGNCDDTVWALAEELGWKGELETLVQEGQKKFKKSGSVEGGEGEAGGDGAGQVHGGKL